MAWAALAGAVLSASVPARGQTGAPLDCVSIGRLEVERFYTTTGMTGTHPRADYYVAVHNPDPANGVLFVVTFDSPDLYRQARDEARLLRPGQYQRVLLGSAISPDENPVPELTQGQLQARTSLMCQ